MATPTYKKMRSAMTEKDPAECKWSRKPESDAPVSPHFNEPFVPHEPKICDTILDHIGHTPLVRLNKVSAGLECEILAKCEFFNAGGSLKDRIGRRMVEDAERSGRIKPGETLIEATSGNTGIGLALCAAVKGYRMIITLPEKMSNEKVNTLRALGAEIIRTPTEAAWDAPESHIGVAERLNNELPNSHILDQYSNPSNPLAHYDGTAEEILWQCDGKVDMVVVAAGTGGTIAGIGRKIKEKNPDCIVVGVDPEGSILAQPDSLNGKIGSYQIEGIGYDFIPRVCDRSVVDYWIKSNDVESFAMARRLIKEEGLLCGGSSGTVVAAALKAASSLKKGQRCVCILPDSIRNYMTKFLSDDWMIEHKFMEAPLHGEWWADRTVADLQLEKPITVSSETRIKDAIHLMKGKGVDQFPVLDDSGKVLGTITIGNLTALVTNGRLTLDDSVSKALYKQFKSVPSTTKLSYLSFLFNTHHFVIIQDEGTVVGVASGIDLLHFISSRESARQSPAHSPRGTQ